MADDGSLPPDNLLAHWGPTIIEAASQSGRAFDLFDGIEDRLREAGFVDIRTHVAKWPLGPWPRDKKLKEAGTVNHQHWAVGMDGYAMFLLTKFGLPTPWSMEEVQIYTAKLRKELSNSRFHIYHRMYAASAMLLYAFLFGLLTIP